MGLEGSERRRRWKRSRSPGAPPPERDDSMTEKVELKYESIARRGCNTNQTRPFLSTVAVTQRPTGITLAEEVADLSPLRLPIHVFEV